MFPPIFAVCASDGAVTSVLGIAPTRLFAFGGAPENAVLPYAAWSIVSGSPGNFLSGRPVHDEYTLQVDVYAATGQAALDAAERLRDAIEPHAHIVAWRMHGRDPETRNYRIGFDVDWIVRRPPFVLTPAYEMYASGYGVYRREFDVSMNEAYPVA